MSYKYRSRRSAKRLASKSRRNFLFTLIIIAILVYSTITWILPFLINGLGFIKNIIQPLQKPQSSLSENAALAPPVLNIPYEATNTGQIDIRGYGNPNSKINLYVDDEKKQTVSVESDGSFKLEKISLNLGTNNIYAKTLDEENRESLPSKLLKIIFDNEKPNLTVNEPEDGKKIQGGDKKIKISGKVDPGIKVFVNENQIIVDKDGNFTTDSALNDGNIILTIKAVDPASNFTEVQRTVTYNP